MDEEKRDEILVRLDERTERVDEHLRRLQEDVDENESDIDELQENVASNKTDIRNGKGLLAVLGTILSAMFAKLTGLLHI